MVSRRPSKKRDLWTSAAARRLRAMAGEPPTIEDAVRITTKQILKGVSCPPTDLDAVASSLNITGFYPEELPISGELRRDGKGFKIIYSSYLSDVRRRFTIAHEMAHAIFEGSGPNCPRIGRELERLCDMLATEILMPHDVFLQLAGTRVSSQKLFELARTFKTSLSATAIRLAEVRGISVFEVEDEIITWSYGVVRKGPVREKHDDLKRAIETAFTVEYGDAVMFMNSRSWTGMWKLDWARIGQGGRALFLLEPLRSSNQICG